MSVIKSRIALEIEQFKRFSLTLQNGRPLVWWSLHAAQFPLLPRVARRVLAVLATSASSERSFSEAGLLVTKKRSSLSSDLVAQMTLLRGWYKLMEKNSKASLPNISLFKEVEIDDA